MCARVLDIGLVRAVGVTPASVTAAISPDQAEQAVALQELHIDRAYVRSHFVRERSDEHWRCIAKPGLFERANAFRSRRLRWIGNGRSSAVLPSRRCPLCSAVWSTFPSRSALRVL